MSKWWLVVLACAGCGTKDAGGGGESAVGFAKLSVTVNEKPVTFTRAFIKHLPDGQYQLWMGERGGSCAALLDNTFDGKIHDLLVNLPVRLAADGKETGTVADLSYSMPPTDADPGGTSTVKGDPVKGAKLDVDLAFTGEGGKGEKLVVKGSLVAESCGEDMDPQVGMPKAPHPSTATMTIAGKVFKIGGAIKKDERYELVEVPRECDAAKHIGARLQVAYGVWRLDGTRFGKEHSSDAAFVVTPGATGTSADGPVVELTLSGEGKVADYPVKLDGKVEALVCK
ncbi:MAG: hypothetical protein H0T79_21770 [Deltaproteobacteria bacterium]|nr:hypothetical protein [Deltaproteobacteria bacterium]